jgi:hypothetical protein
MEAQQHVRAVFGPVDAVTKRQVDDMGGQLPPELGELAGDVSEAGWRM